MELSIKSYKLEIFIPESHLSQLQAALRAAGAGRIGNYDSCMSYSPVTGVWRPLDGAAPFIGRDGELCTAPELKVEVVCPQEILDATIAGIKSVHPYETPVINVIPLLQQ